MLYAVLYHFQHFIFPIEFCYKNKSLKSKVSISLIIAIDYNLCNNTFYPTFLHNVCPILIIKNPQIKFKIGIKRVHFKELITLAGYGEVVTTLEKGLRLQPGFQPRGRTLGLVWLNHGWEWFPNLPSPTGLVFCMTQHPAGIEVHCDWGKSSL